MACAVLLPVIVAMAGLGVDMGQVYVAHSKLQASVDAAALAGSLQMPYDPNLSTGQVVQAVNQVLADNYGPMPVEKQPAATRIYQGTEIRSVCVEAQQTTQTIFLGALNAISGTTVATSKTVTAKACAGFNNLEVALVIDNTGSMSGTPITKVREASTNLVNLILPTGGAPSTKVGLVPFRGKVHVAANVDGLPDGCRNADGSLNTGLPKKYWINATASSKGSGTAPIEGGSSTSGSSTAGGTSTSGGKVSSSVTKGGGSIALASASGIKGSGKTSGSTGSQGGGDSSSGGSKTGGTTPIEGGGSSTSGVSTQSYLPPGVSADTCSSIPAIQALTTDKTTILNSISKMTCLGNASGTVISEGIKWGAQILTPETPYAEGGDPKKFRKVMIVLTDGDTEDGTCGGPYQSYSTPNNYWTNAYYGMGVENYHCEDGGRLNQAMLDAATAAKAQGIEIFAIRFGDSDTVDRNLMKAIASSKAGTTDHYYDAPTAADIPEIFRKIGRQLGWRLLN